MEQDDSQTVFSEWFTEKLSASGMTLSKLHEVSGISQSYLSELKGNKRSDPSERILQRLAQAFNCSLAEAKQAAGSTPPSDVLLVAQYEDATVAELLGDVISSMCSAVDVVTML